MDEFKLLILVLVTFMALEIPGLSEKCIAGLSSLRVCSLTLKNLFLSSLYGRIIDKFLTL